MQWRSKRCVLAALSLISLTLTFIYWNREPQAPEQYTQDPLLGFDDIYVVSTDHESWRSKGLRAAAARTNLDVTFLNQPRWTDHFKKDFHAGDKYATWDLPGSTGCWLGHLNALETMLEKDHSSVLLLEDDADWDVTIHDQVESISEAVKELTGSDGIAQPGFWGSDWDILFLGHCGDRLPDSYLAFADHSVPAIANYAGWHYDTLAALPPNTRAVHKSIRPVCTFGYAVTAAGASKIISLDHTAKAIDTRMGRACKEGELRCITVNPEIIHHHVPQGEAPSVIQMKQAPAKVAWTANIKHSARCNANRTLDHLIECSSPPPEYENFYKID